jgi:hypothetical protein
MVEYATIICNKPKCSGYTLKAFGYNIIVEKAPNAMPT